MRKLATGQGIKEKKITVRVSQELYDELQIEAKQNKVSISECARWRLANKREKLNLIPQLCRLSTSINLVMNKYDVNDDDKELICTEVVRLWQLLN